MGDAMRIIIILFSAAVALSACSSGPSPLARANADGNRTAAVADGFISNGMSISGCPLGYRPVDVQIRTSSDADLTNINGHVGYQIGAAGTRTQKCVR